MAYNENDPNVSQQYPEETLYWSPVEPTDGSTTYSFKLYQAYQSDTHWYSNTYSVTSATFDPATIVSELHTLVTDDDTHSMAVGFTDEYLTFVFADNTWSDIPEHIYSGVTVNGVFGLTEPTATPPAADPTYELHVEEVYNGIFSKNVADMVDARPDEPDPDPDGDGGSDPTDPDTPVGDNEVVAVKYPRTVRTTVNW